MTADAVLPADAPAPRPPASVRFLLRDSAVYGLSNALVKLTALVTVPIMTRVLSQADYGATDALSVLLAVFVAFSTLGQDSAVARFFYDVESQADRVQVVMQGLAAQLAMCAVVVAIALLAGPYVLASRAGAGYASAYYLIVACVPVVLLFQFWRGLLKWLLARNQFVALSVGTALLNLAALAALAARDALTVRSFFVAMLVTHSVSAALGLYFCRAYVAWPRGMAFAGPMLRYGAPYAAVLLVGTALPAIDRAIVTTRLGLVPLAEYAVGLKYASLLLFPVMAFQTAWGPFCFATYKDPAAPDVYSRVLTLLAAGLALACFLLVALAEPLIALFASPAYVSAAPIVIPVAFGLAVEGCSWILGIGIDLSKRTELSLYSYVLGLVVSVVGALLLVGRFGIVGVAWGICIGRVIQAVAYSVLGQRAYPLVLRWRRPVLTLAATLAISVVTAQVPVTATAQAVAVRTVGLALVVFVGVAGLGPADLAQLRRLRARRAVP